MVAVAFLTGAAWRGKKRRRKGRSVTREIRGPTPSPPSSPSRKKPKTHLLSSRSSGLLGSSLLSDGSSSLLDGSGLLSSSRLSSGSLDGGGLRSRDGLDVLRQTVRRSVFETTTNGKGEEEDRLTSLSAAEILFNLTRPEIPERGKKREEKSG